MELGKILFSGGTGYLGSNLIDFLQPYKLDLTLFRRGMDVTQQSGFDTVIHAAYFKDLEAEKQFIKSIPQYCYFVFFSSAAIYGETSLEGADIYDPPKPINDYGKYKLELENLVKKHFERCLILRIANPYGREPGLRGVYQIFKSRIEQGLDLEIYSEKPGQIIRDFVTIDVFCKKVSRLLIKKTHGCFNISSGKGTSLEDFAKAINPHARFCYLNFREHEIRCSVLKS